MPELPEVEVVRRSLQSFIIGLKIKKVSVLEYPELGMEAVWKIEVKNFPAFMVIDNKGNDFFK